MSEDLSAPGDRPGGDAGGGRPIAPPSPELVSRGTWIAATAAFVLAALFGALVTYTITGRHMLPIGLLNGSATSGIAATLWRLVAVGRLRFRPLMGALAFMAAAIAGVFVTSVLLMFQASGNGPLADFDQILEMAVAVASLTARQLGIVVFPTAALAGYLVTRDCEVHRLAAIA